MPTWKTQRSMTTMNLYQSRTILETAIFKISVELKNKCFSYKLSFIVSNHFAEIVLLVKLRPFWESLILSEPLLTGITSLSCASATIVLSRYSWRSARSLPVTWCWCQKPTAFVSKDLTPLVFFIIQASWDSNLVCFNCCQHWQGNDHCTSHGSEKLVTVFLTTANLEKFCQNTEIFYYNFLCEFEKFI